MKSTGYPTPTHTNNKQNSSNINSLILRKLFKPTAISLLVASTALPFAYAAPRDYTNEDLSSSNILFDLKDNDEDIGNVDLSIEADARQNFFVMTVNGADSDANNDSFQIQDVDVTLISNKVDTSSGQSDQGTYVLKANNHANVSILGDIDITVAHSNEVNKFQDSSIGANGIWVKNHSVVNLGSAETTTRIWTLADKPDSISAKVGAQVNFISTRNQIVGSMDLLGLDSGDTSYITGTFSGKDSYWFGDEFSRRNASGLLQLAIDNPTLAELILGFKVDPADGILDLTFEEGAQWSYLGVTAEFKDQAATQEKRISAITLRNGGIINLYDKNLEEIWKNIHNENLEQSLYDALSSNPEFEMTHDYVRIGDLKGSGGIFRIDTNGEDKSQTDLIFIENSTDGGTHHIQIEGLETLGSITEDNTLTFAMVSKAASDAGVAFHEIENVEGDKLFNYELDIRGMEYSEEDFDELQDRVEFDGLPPANIPLIDSPLNDVSTGGTRWEIYRVVRSNSASTLGMIGSGYAGYDLAVDMDRRDRRIHESVHENGSEQGLWVRVSHGQKGASGVYKNDVDTVKLGFEGAPSSSWRLGGWFSYATGDVDYSNVRGTADLERYEAALYGTFLSGNHYLDLVGRFGRVANEFDVTSNSGALRTTGDYDQDYAAISAEYGYTLRDAATGFFLEPQLQIQAAYLRDFDYSTERGMRVYADDETSVIGRTGFRFGRQFRSNESTGEAYLRGDVLHQFTDGQSATLKADADRISTTWGDKDTWANFGVGAFWNWKDRFSLQLDLERTVGGETVDTWLMSGHARYYF